MENGTNSKYKLKLNFLTRKLLGKLKLQLCAFNETFSQQTFQLAKCLSLNFVHS